MKHYLLDTNILGHLAEYKANIQTGQSNFAKHYKSLPASAKLFICAISIGEVEYGFKVNYENGLEKLQYVRNLIDAFPIELRLNVDSNVAGNCYSKLRAKLFEKFAPKDKRKKSNRIEQWKIPVTAKELQIQENDIWIASVAMAYNLILVTNDKMALIKEVVGADLEIIGWV